MNDRHFWVVLKRFAGFSIFGLLLAGLGVGGVNAENRWHAEIEGGGAWSGYNDVQIPNETGTEFSLTDDLKTDSDIFYRIRIGYRFSERHEISALFAPLSLNAKGTINRSISYNGTTFPADSELEGKYKFNSYRLTYRYHFGVSPKIKMALGLTAKIRDAAIKIESNTESSEKTNVGLVPLISFRFDYDFSEPLSLFIDGDALAAPQGRAEDIKAGLEYDISDSVALNAGYRILEGGADVDEVYNFALIHYLSVGMTIRF